MGHLRAAICNSLKVRTVYEFFEIVFRNKINAIPLQYKWQHAAKPIT